MPGDRELKSRPAGVMQASAGQAVALRTVAGQLFRKLVKKFLVNNDRGLAWACTEWAVRLEASMEAGAGDVNDE